MMRLARRLKGANLGYSTYDRHLIVYITGLGQLNGARERLRKAVGGWTDRVGQIWCSGDCACVSWSCSDCQDVEIWMTGTLIEDFPKSLIKPGCGFIRQGSSATTYACNIREESDG